MAEKKGTAPAAAAKTPAVSLVQDDAAGTYAIGATIDGEFVPFYTRPISEVQSHVETQKAAREAASSSGTGGQ